MNTPYEEHLEAEIYSYKKMISKLEEIIEVLKEESIKYREAMIEAINENGSVGDKRFMVNQILEKALESESEKTTKPSSLNQN